MKLMSISKIATFVISGILLSNCMSNNPNSDLQAQSKGMKEKKMGLNSSPTAEQDTATFAGGCFWCTEAAFEEVDGVQKVTSGYAGSAKMDPSYEEVSSGTTGLAEAVQIIFDPSMVSYSELLNVYWHSVDPTDATGSFYDRGSQYRSVIFYHNAGQKMIAWQSKQATDKLGVFNKPIVTAIEKFMYFYPAESYHQDYYKKNPQRYNAYHMGSGRDAFIEKHWGDYDKRLAKFKKPSPEKLKKQLTPLQCDVTQNGATERPFDNPYWNNHEEGIYVDVVSGEPLFSSIDKFKSGTGWPSFTKPIEKENIIEKSDYSLMMKRTEVRSKYGDSHLGHLFNDGPQPTGQRYCINSASLRFIPKAEMEKLGYGKYLSLFK